MSKGNGFPPQVRCASNFPPPLVSHTRHNHSRGGIVACHELLLVEILSRLPVKSLMRFKCVCKHWQTLIQNDQYFIHLHYARSQTRNSGSAVTPLLIIPSPMFTFGERVFLLAELQLLLEGGCPVRATIHGKVPSMLHPYISILKPVNGLLCCVDSDTYSVCIQNPSTRVSTPWIRSIVKQQQEAEAKTIKSINEHGDLVMYAVRYINLLRYTFGYDPATKEHKVISLWVRELANWKLGNREDWLCEVLTVGHHTWRVVEAIPPISPYNLLTHHSVYANGSIYWLHPGSDEYVPNDAGPVIVEFNVGLEKFRVISVPIFIIDDIRAPYAFSTELMEVNGNLVLLAKKIRWPDRLEDTSIKNHDASMKMCTLHVHQDKIKKVDRSQSSTGTDYFWTGDSFLMPPFDWTPGSLDCVVSIPGTDMFIVKSTDPFSFYFYNWKQKRFSDKLQLHGIRPFIDENVTDQPFDFRLFTLAENLFPVY